MTTPDPALYWLIVGTILFVLEIASPGFILFFFAVGALITSLVTWLLPLSLAWQLGIFIVASVGALYALRDFIQKKFTGSGNQDEDIDQLPMAVPGDKGVVTITITPSAEGQIKYSGSFWRATAKEVIEVGQPISIVKQKNLLIHVEKT